MPQNTSKSEWRVVIDYVLVFGRDQEEHDQRLNAVKEKIQAAGVTLNHATLLGTPDQ